MSSQRSNSMEASQDNIRKRVCKACDRCRLKKSKCDGASPCSRCKADNAICVFGERKKSQDKVYPKGYVEMLEQQQSQLVAGLRDLYSRLQNGQAWPGQPLREAQSGHPLTHDILERLDLLHSTGEGSSNYDGFEEDCNKMQQKLLESGAPFTHRRGSMSSNSDHGLSSSSRSSYDGTPPTKSIPYIDPFARNNAPPTPPMTSSFPRQSQIVHSIKQEAPMVSPTFMGTGALDPAALSQAPAWSAEPMMMDDTMYNFDTFTSFNSEPMILDPLSHQSNPPMPDWTDTNDLDFNTFIHSQVGA